MYVAARHTSLFLLHLHFSLYPNKKCRTCQCAHSFVSTCAFHSITEKTLHSLELNRKQLSLHRKQRPSLFVSLYPDATGKESKFSSWVLTFAKLNSWVMPTQMVIIFCKVQPAYLRGCQSCENWVLHLIGKSVGWFPLYLSMWLLENSFFWKMMLFWQWFFFCKIFFFAVDANVYHVYHWDWDVCLDIYLDVAYKRFYLYLHILVKCGWRSHRKTCYNIHTVQWGGEAVPFMCQEAEDVGGTSACGEYQRSLFPLLQTSLKKKHTSLKCNLFQPLRR